jgi:predicted esterase
VLRIESPISVRLLGALRICFGVLWCVAAPRSAMSQDPPGVGVQEITFSERDPLGSIREQSKRFNWQANWVKQQDPSEGEYDIAKEKYRVVVPAGDDPDKPYGMFVWISPGQSGNVPAEWYPTLERHRLIVIGADNSGNQRLVWDRMGLAIDAVFNLKKRYRIDDRRVYVAGFSGGARMASRLGMQYPDIFQGGMYIGACDYFRRIPVPDNPRAFWPEAFPAPTGKRAELVRKERSHVFVAGTEDANLPAAREMYTYATKRDKFLHAHWIEMPGVGHAPPDASHFEQAIKDLTELAKEGSRE